MDEVLFDDGPERDQKETSGSETSSNTEIVRFLRFESSAVSHVEERLEFRTHPAAILGDATIKAVKAPVLFLSNSLILQLLPIPHRA